MTKDSTKSHALLSINLNMEIQMTRELYLLINKITVVRYIAEFYKSFFFFFLLKELHVGVVYART